MTDTKFAGMRVIAVHMQTCNSFKMYAEIMSAMDQQK